VVGSRGQAHALVRGRGTKGRAARPPPHPLTEQLNTDDDGRPGPPDVQTVVQRH